MMGENEPRAWHPRPPPTPRPPPVFVF